MNSGATPHGAVYIDCCIGVVGFIICVAGYKVPEWLVTWMMGGGGAAAH